MTGGSQHLRVPCAPTWMPNVVPHSQTEENHGSMPTENGVLGITLKDRISNVRLQNIVATVSIGQWVTATKWKWGGHVARLKDDI